MVPSPESSQLPGTYWTLIYIHSLSHSHMPKSQATKIASELSTVDLNMVWRWDACLEDTGLHLLPQNWHCFNSVAMGLTPCLDHSGEYAQPKLHSILYAPKHKVKGSGAQNPEAEQGSPVRFFFPSACPRRAEYLMAKAAHMLIRGHNYHLKFRATICRLGTQEH